MSYHLIDFSQSQEPDYSFDNMLIGRKIMLDNDSSRYYIYIMENKEIYIRLPKVRLIYSMGNNKYTQTNIPLYPNNNINNKFIDFIKNLEHDIFECFKNKNINKEFSKEFSSLISKKNNITFLKTNITDQLKLTSNLNRNITLNDFSINGEIEMVIKLSYIWTNINKIGLSCHLYQIKYHGSPSQLNHDFIDINKDTKPEIIIRTNNKAIINNEIEENTNVTKRMIPSIKDLQNAIKGLKKSD